MTKLLLYISFIFISLNSFSQTSKLVFKDCTAEDFLSNLKQKENAIVLDVRTEKQYKRQRIKGAVLAKDYQSARKILKDKPKDTPLFIYCNTGDNSISIAALLMRDGYTCIYHLHDGLNDWWRAGYKLDKRKMKNIATVSDLNIQ